MYPSVGDREARPANDIAHQFCQCSRGRIRGDRASQPPIDLIGGEQLTGVRPQLVQSRLHPPMALFRSVAQPEDPLTAVPDVIARLLVGLGGDPASSVCDARWSRLEQ